MSAADDAGPDAPPAFLPARPLTQGDLTALTERVRRRVIAFFKRQGFLNAHAAADMLAWENSGFSIDASVRITLLDRDVPSYFQSLEHLLRYCARPPFALERLSVIRDADSRIARIRYVLPRHKAANWVGRKRKSTQPGASGVIELSPFEFLDRLADLVPPPRKHRHRYHGVFAPNHPPAQHQHPCRLSSALVSTYIGIRAEPVHSLLYLFQRSLLIDIGVPSSRPASIPTTPDSKKRAARFPEAALSRAGNQPAHARHAAR